MTTLFIDNGVSINLDDYMEDPIGKFKRTPPMFVATSVGERLAIADFTKHRRNSVLIRDYMERTFMLNHSRKQVAIRSYNETMDGLIRANPNGWRR